MSAVPTEITLRRPDDWHLHLRDGAMLAAVLPWSARWAGRAIVMPNLVPPVTTAAAARAYRERILAALPAGADFHPLMTCYLTDDTDARAVVEGFRDGSWAAAKLYPAHATTNSAAGVTDPLALRPLFEAMAAAGMPLLVHGEVTDPAVDIFDREAVFLERVLDPLVRAVPGLRVVLEHVTTADGVAFVEAAPATVGATITPHHLVIDRNALFAGGLRPHAYCLPVAKRRRHRDALRAAATGGSDRFFLGTDSAPHLVAAKESACGCAGIFNAPHALEVLAEVFEEEGALERLEAFASLNGARFYGVSAAIDMITVRREATVVPADIATALGPVIPFRSGETLGWRLVP